MTFSTTALEEIVQNAVQSVQEKIVFAEHLRKELATYKVQLVSGSDEFKFLKVCYEKLAKKGNAEKFYSDFYGEVSVNSCRFFTGLSRNAATLLTMKVADSMVAHCKKQNQPSSINTNSKVNQQCTLSDKEVAGLQYLGGYVLQNLYRKHARFDSTESQQAMLIIKAGKKESDDKQKLISSLNRGGLWLITEQAEKIFKKTEKQFRLLTKPGVQRIDFVTITNKSATDSDVLSNYHLMVADVDCKADDQVAKDVLHCIINLYVRV